MAPEKVLALALSGEEIRKAILDRLSHRLERDGFLNPGLAYDYFSATITIDVMCHDVGRDAPVKVTETVTVGERPEGDVEQRSGEFTIDAQPPNEVRVETGQEVPVLGKGTDGRPEEKRIKYKRTAAKPKV